jgi:hypothetical protein
MAKKPDTPCAGCGKLLWTRKGSLPPGKRMCRTCRSAPPPAAIDSEPLPEPVPAWMPGAGLGPRGRALWREMNGATLDVSRRVLLEEACRIADRCDQLDDFLRGREEAWMRFQALSEARQQAATLKALLAELRAKTEAPKREASRIDDLAKRRDERRRAAGL